MADRGMVKTLGGLIPDGTDSGEWFAKIKNGQEVQATIRMPRNGGFHRKFYAMINWAYENNEWPVMQDPTWGEVTVSLDMFRKYVIVKTGHVHAELTPSGQLRAVAKSISFASMSQAEFEVLYSDALDVIIKEFLGQKGWTKEKLDNAVNQAMSFA